MKVSCFIGIFSLFVSLIAHGNNEINDKKYKDFLDQKDNLTIELSLELELVRLWRDTKHINHAASLFNDKKLTAKEIVRVRKVVVDQIFDLDREGLIHNDTVISHFASLLLMFYYTSRDYFDGKIEFKPYNRIYKFVKTYGLDYVNTILFRYQSQ